MKTSRAHTLRPWRFEVVDVTIYSLPNKRLADGKVEHEVDNAIMAFCGWCGNGTLVLNPDEWFASRRRLLRRDSNKDYVGRSCTYCFSTCLRPERAEYDRLVQEGM